MKVKIYNLRFNQNKGFKTIARELGVSKNTVKNYVKQFEIQLKAMEHLNKSDYDAMFTQLFDKNIFDSSSRFSKLITPDIERFIIDCLANNQKKRNAGKRKMVMKNIDIFEKAVELHNFQGSRSTLNNWINAYSNKAKQAYIKRMFNCGEICEFDWGNVTLIIGGEEITFKIAVFCLPFSNYRKAYLYEAENTDAFLDSHIKFFREIGCIPATMVYDNMRVAIAKFVGKTEKRPTKALSDMASFYGFKFRFCNIYSGNEKGSVEKSVDIIRRKSFSFSDQFVSFEDAKTHLSSKVAVLNEDKITSFKEEYSVMRTIQYDFSYGEMTTVTVSKYSCIQIKSHYYSVPDKYVGKILTAKATINYIHIYDKHKLIATHDRQIGQQKWKLDIMHFQKLLSQKPGGILDSMAFKTMSSELDTFYKAYFIGQELEFIKTLVHIKEHGIEAVDLAIQKLSINSSTINSSAIVLTFSTVNTKPIYQIEINDAITTATNESISKLAALGSGHGN